MQRVPTFDRRLIRIGRIGSSRTVPTTPASTRTPTRRTPSTGAVLRIAPLRLVRLRTPAGLERGGDPDEHTKA